MPSRFRLDQWPNAYGQIGRVHVQYFHQILTVVLESLDDPDAVLKELALTVIYEMLSNQVNDRHEPTCVTTCCKFQSPSYTYTVHQKLNLLEAEA